MHPRPQARGGPATRGREEMGSATPKIAIQHGPSVFLRQSVRSRLTTDHPIRLGPGCALSAAAILPE